MLIRTALRISAEVSKKFRVSLRSHVAICQPTLGSEQGRERERRGSGPLTYRASLESLFRRS